MNAGMTVNLRMNLGAKDVDEPEGRLTYLLRIRRC